MSATDTEQRLHDFSTDTALGRMIVNAGGMGSLVLVVARELLRPPYPWWRDAIVEFSTAFRRCLVPLVVSMITFAFGIAVLFVGQIVGTLGTSDRLVGGLIEGFTREPAEWVAAMILAGVGGSAITADLGARKIRDEIEALDVLGVNRIRTLVIPRVVGMAFAAPALGMVCLLVCQIVDFAMIPQFYSSVSYGGELETIRAFMYGPDIIELMLKMVLVGVTIGIVSCYKGLNCGGGAEGVGRAVNQAVVLTFLILWVLNAFLNLAYLAQFPSVLALRG